jgi:hypothetical protein
MRAGVENGNAIMQGLAASISTMAAALVAPPAASDPAAGASLVALEIILTNLQKTVEAGQEDTKTMFA